MNAKSVDDLKLARDYLFELFDHEDREELKVALRLVNREIRRRNDAREPAPSSPARPTEQGWSEQEDRLLREKLAHPTSSKDEAKRILTECSEALNRTDAETYSRIRTLQLHANLHAWGNKPKVQWQTMHVRSDEPPLPGASRTES